MSRKRKPGHDSEKHTQSYEMSPAHKVIPTWRRSIIYLDKSNTFMTDTEIELIVKHHERKEHQKEKNGTDDYNKADGWDIKESFWIDNLYLIQSLSIFIWQGVCVSFV